MRPSITQGTVLVRPPFPFFSSNHTDPPAWPANYDTIHIAKKTGAEGLNAPWIQTQLARKARQRTGAA
jgi:hypothetical protein